MLKPTQKQVRDYLVSLARKGYQPVTYGDLAHRFDLVIRHNQDMRFWSDLLEQISRAEHAAGRPLLSVLVISVEKNRPGNGFYKLAQELGRYEGNLYDDMAQMEFYVSEMAAVRAEWEEPQKKPQPIMRERPTAYEVAPPAPDYVEGEAVEISLTRYERSGAARQACLAHYGAVCQVCDFDFEQVYGERGRGFIHVHHRTELAGRGQTEGAHGVDPVRDLVPVCPNCHAMLHVESPPTAVETLRELVQSRRDSLL